MCIVTCVKKIENKQSFSINQYHFAHIPSKRLHHKYVMFTGERRFMGSWLNRLYPFLECFPPVKLPCVMHSLRQRHLPQLAAFCKSVSFFSWLISDFLYPYRSWSSNDNIISHDFVVLDSMPGEWNQYSSCLCQPTNMWYNKHRDCEIRWCQTYSCSLQGKQ